MAKLFLDNLACIEGADRTSQAGIDVLLGSGEHLSTTVQFLTSDQVKAATL